MSRPLRIEYPGACYYVNNQGSNHRIIFDSPSHYQIFLELLNDIYQRYQVKIHGYSMLANQYHLLVETPKANVSQAIGYLNSVYARRINKVKRCDGPLFRCRFKSILFEKSTHLLTLSRHIHRLPVVAKHCSDPLEYQWSSCQAICQGGNHVEWLFDAEIKSQCQQQGLDCKDAVAADTEQDFKIIKCSGLPLIGSEQFVEEVTQRYKLSHAALPEKANSGNEHQVRDIIKMVSDYFQVTTFNIMESRRGIPNQVRDLTIYLLIYSGVASFSHIIKLFNMASYTSVSTAITRAKKLFESNPKMKKHYLAVKKNLAECH